MKYHAGGRRGPAIEKALGDIKPEAVYFTAKDGQRGGVMIVNMDDASKMPAVAEPLFLSFNATVEFLPAMTPEDLGNAGLDAIGKSYA